MANLFDRVATSLKNSSFVLWVHILAWIMVMVGILHFVEDTISSRNGIESLELLLNLKPVNMRIVYWTLSISPQVAQMVLFYQYAMDKSVKSLVGAFWFFLMDFTADVQDRSNGYFWSDGQLHIMAPPGVNGLFGLDPRSLAAAFFALNFYTIGSELFISIGIGLILATWKMAIEQSGKLSSDLNRASREANRLWQQSQRRQHANSQQQPQPARQQHSGGQSNRRMP